jgi:hypothetical protein
MIMGGYQRGEGGATTLTKRGQAEGWFMMSLRLSSLLGSLLFLCACQTTPSDADFQRTYRYFLEQSKKELAELDARKARGDISAEDYRWERQRIEDDVVKKANDRVLTEHQLKESERRAMGMPTPQVGPAVLDIPSGPVGPRSSPGGQNRPGF